MRRLPRRPRDGGGEDEVPARNAEYRNRGAVYSKLLMLTGAALVNPGSTLDRRPGQSSQHQAEYQRGARAVCGDARQGSPAAGNPLRFVAVADRPREDPGPCGREFPSVMQDLIAVGVKTHFIYYVVAKNNAYKQPLPDVLEDRPGQMDALASRPARGDPHPAAGQQLSNSSA